MYIYGMHQNIYAALASQTTEQILSPESENFDTIQEMRAEEEVGFKTFH